MRRSAMQSSCCWLLLVRYHQSESCDRPCSIGILRTHWGSSLTHVTYGACRYFVGSGRNRRMNLDRYSWSIAEQPRGPGMPFLWVGWAGWVDLMFWGCTFFCVLHFLAYSAHSCLRHHIHACKHQQPRALWGCVLLVALLLRGFDTNCAVRVCVSRVFTGA